VVDVYEEKTMISPRQRTIQRTARDYTDTKRCCGITPAIWGICGFLQQTQLAGDGNLEIKKKKLSRKCLVIS
jgi:hypothetical protein